ncbi:MAG: TatD family hydrolase [Moraxellaceae bacterium]|nr:TatD family hydrolase [Moraxellaceae bacterium]
MRLIDTHTHLDFPVFEQDRIQQAQLATEQGIEQLVITAYIAKYFTRILQVQNELNQHFQKRLQTHIALGLHPFFIEEHKENHLRQLEKLIQTQKIIAIGEIGLDTFDKQLKQADIFAKQCYFFQNQLDLANKYQLPVILHIRKAHAYALKILKNHQYNAHHLGGIAHSFSGGEQEAKSFVKLGFKLGITGQVCNPNAKKLRRAIIAVVKDFGLSSLVIETDCPDMLPLPLLENNQKKTRNTPSNLIYVLNALSELLQIDKEILSKQLWQNSYSALSLIKRHQ